MTTLDREREAGVVDDAGLRRVVKVLSLTEIVSWGVLYYTFPVLSDAISDSTGWSQALLFAAFSASQIIAGLTSIPVGRLLDRLGPRPVMSTGTVLAVISVLIIATAPTLLVFTLGWLLAGLAMSAVLYVPAFSTLARWGGAAGDRTVRALTTVTLVAGFASTVFAPAAAQLEAAFGWRNTFVVLGIVLLVLTLPAHVLGLLGHWEPVVYTGRRRRDDDLRGPRERAPFVWLVVIACLASFALHAVLVNLVPLLLSRGIGLTDAAVVLGVGGAGQVAGRLFYARLASRTTLQRRTSATLAVIAVSIAAFAAVPGPVWLLAVLSFAAGTARGVFTLLQATAVPDRWGTHGVGRLNGLLAGPALVAGAVAPAAAAAAAGYVGGLAVVFGGLAAVALAAAVLVPRTLAPDG